MKYIKKFDTHAEYDAYINGSDAILPNVSICTTEGDVHYNPYVPPTPVETRLVCKYNVTNTSEETKLCYDTDGFSSIEIDGVVQPSVVSAYTFSTTGEHTVKYILTDPTSVDSSNGAFKYCSDLTSVTIPNGVISIGDGAFVWCTNLTSIDIPNSVTSIGYNAFSNCSSLTSIDIPNSVTSIGAGAFCDCISLDATSIAAIETINEEALLCG